MKYFVYLVQMVLVASLAACGGGGSGSGGGSGDGSGGGNGGSGGSGGGSGAPKLHDSRQIIDYYGDSTIFGWLSGSRDEVQVDTPAPEAFDAALGGRHLVRNRGSSGTRACDLLDGYGFDQGLPWAERMDASDATVVIINHGLNDSIGQMRYSLGEYRNCLSQLVDIARNKGKVVILETPNPAEDPDGRLRQFVQEMRNIASEKGVNLIDQYGFLEQYMRDNNVPVSGENGICPDGIHPSQAIYIEKGRFAAQRFQTFERR